MARTGVTQILTGGNGGASRSADLGVLLLRVFFGLALALAHGLKKLPPSERFVAGVVEMGFPAPLVFAWLSTFAEFFCALLLVIGLATRPAAVFVAINMAVAAFIRQAGDPFGEIELALAYLVVAIAFVLTGAGRYSIDTLISRPRRSLHRSTD
jgi:putative oxidoreductase